KARDATRRGRRARRGWGGRRGRTCALCTPSILPARSTLASRRPCGPLPQGAVGAGPPVGVARLLGDGDGLEAGDEPDEHGRDLGPAAVEGERFEVGGGRAGPAPVGPELLGLLPVVPVVPRAGALLDGLADRAEVEGEEGRQVLGLVVEAAGAEGGVLGEEAEGLGAGAEVGVAALGGRLAGVDDAAHPIADRGSGIAE